YLRGKLALAGARGDAELYILNATLLGDTKGELAIALQIERGELSMFGRWTGKPSGVFAKLVGVTAPRPEPQGASGFVAVNIAPLLGELPPLPITGEITLDALAKTLVGPVSAIIPAGSVDIQVSAPLSDPKLATAVIDHCQDVGRFL